MYTILATNLTSGIFPFKPLAYVLSWTYPSFRLSFFSQFHDHSQSQICACKIIRWKCIARSILLRLGKIIQGKLKVSNIHLIPRRFNSKYNPKCAFFADVFFSDQNFQSQKCCSSKRKKNLGKPNFKIAKTFDIDFFFVRNKLYAYLWLIWFVYAYTHIIKM